MPVFKILLKLSRVRILSFARQRRLFSRVSAIFVSTIFIFLLVNNGVLKGLAGYAEPLTEFFKFPPSCIMKKQMSGKNMRAVSYSNARKNLRALIQSVCKDSEPAIIVSSKSEDPAVLISLDDFQAMEETAYLLNSPANRKHIENSLQEIKDEKLVEFISPLFLMKILFTQEAWKDFELFLDNDKRLVKLNLV